MTLEGADTFPVLICRDSRYGETAATCCERKEPTAHAVSFSFIGYMKDLGFTKGLVGC